MPEILISLEVNLYIVTIFLTILFAVLKPEVQDCCVTVIVRFVSSLVQNSFRQIYGKCFVFSLVQNAPGGVGRRLVGEIILKIFRILNLRVRLHKYNLFIATIINCF